MRDSKPQRCVQQHKLLKMTQSATNRDNHINETSKQSFAYDFFKISCKYSQAMFSNWKIFFNVFNIRNYDDFLCNLSKFVEAVQ